jgi:hypothetical protein
MTGPAACSIEDALDALSAETTSVGRLDTCQARNCTPQVKTANVRQHIFIDPVR